MTKPEKLQPTEAEGFWPNWESRFLELGFSPDYIRLEIERLMKHEASWPEGKDDYRQLLDRVLTEIALDLSQPDSTKKNPHQ
jgi:hypothetical protein